MKKILKNTLLAIIFIIIVGVLLLNLISRKGPSTDIVYVNTEYGFNFTLPETWRGYSVTMDEWVGNAMNETGDLPYTLGPIVLIHNPKWTPTNTNFQDIPIMIFTIWQWNDLQSEKFHIGAAPIGPSELARNSVYVFALPARYNFAFPPGYEEVDQIMQSGPLKAFEL